MFLFERNQWSVVSLSGTLLAAVVCSLLLTFFTVALDHLPNDDGVLYLVTAERIAEGFWADAFQLYNWPFYSILIAGVHLLSGLEIEMSAYVINGLMQALLVFAFINIVSELGGDQKTILTAAVLILIFPNLNDYRSEIIRGHGYWAFLMLGLLFLLKYVRQYEFRYLVGWLVGLALAGLFRIEGLVLVALAPLVFLLDSRDAIMLRFKRLALVYGGAVALAGLVLVMVLLTGIGKDSLTLWDKPAYMATQLYVAVSSNLSQKVAILQQDFLIPYTDDYAWSIVVASILIILFTEILASAGFVVGFLAVYGLLRGNMASDVYQRRIVWVFVSVNLLMLAAFVVGLGFLAGRYPIALTLLVMLFVPFGAVALYQGLCSSAFGLATRRKWVNAAFVLVALLFFIDGVFSFSPGKAHVEQAATWLSEHASPADEVFSLNTPLLYRSGTLGWDRYLEYQLLRFRAGDLRAIKEQTLADLLETIDWRQFDYVAALVSRKAPDQQEEIERVLSRSPAKVFANRRGDRVLIYATKTESSERSSPEA